jgi:CheY-like chemotaxis protein
MLKAVLERSGYDVETARDGVAALEKVKSHPESFQLIITDLQMPGLDGLGFIEQAHAAGYGGRVVVYAATISRKDRERLAELHVDRIMAKPARSSELIGAVKELQAAA